MSTNSNQDFSQLLFSTLVHNSYLQRLLKNLYTTFAHNFANIFLSKTLVKKSSSQLFFANLFHNFRSKSMFPTKNHNFFHKTLVENSNSQFFFTTLVQNLKTFYNYCSQLLLTSFVHQFVCNFFSNFCSQLLFAIFIHIFC